MATRGLSPSTCSRTVSIAATDATATKGTNDTAAFTLTRDGGDWSSPLTVQFSIGGSASNGIDYQQIAASATIPVNEASTNITITPMSPGTSVRRCSVVLTLIQDAPASYDVGDPGTPMACIEDPTVPPFVPIPGMVAWWRAEDDGLDSAGNHDGTLLGGATFAPGLVGDAFSFVPSGGRFYVPDSPELQLTQSLTIEGWFKLNGGSVLVHRGDDRPGLDPYQLALNQDMTLVFEIEHSNDDGDWVALVTSESLPVGEWIHIAATLNDSTGQMRIYTNGQVAAEATTSVRPLGPLDPTRDPSLCIGNVSGRYIEFPFDGLADEVSLYNRALSQAEILSICNAGSGGKYALCIPQITFQPGGQQGLRDGPVVFWVGASGCPTLAYQWFHDSVPVSGATNAQLALQAVQFQDAGQYRRDRLELAGIGSEPNRDPHGPGHPSAGLLAAGRHLCLRPDRDRHLPD